MLPLLLLCAAQPQRSAPHETVRPPWLKLKLDEGDSPALLTVLPAYGEAEPKLFGVNWEGVVKGTSYMNITAAGDQGVASWVDRRAPLLSPRLVAGLRTLRVRSLRYPGGAPSNYFNWSNDSFTPPSRCNDAPGPGGCAIYWPTQVVADAQFPRGALGWRSFASLLRQLPDTSGGWSLDIVNQSPQEAVRVLRQLQAAAVGDELTCELGNEVCERLSTNPLS